MFSPDRIKVSELNNLSIKFAGEYVEEHFKGGSQIEKSLVLTTIAHGYYMGARRCEEFASMNFAQKLLLRCRLRVVHKSYLPDHPWLDKEWLGSEGMRGAEAYIKAKNYYRLQRNDVALIRGVLTMGFTKGFLYREFC